MDRRAAVTALLVLVVAACATWFALQASPGQRVPTQGSRLFNGSEPLAGTLAGHGAALPVSATRCVQCHAGPGSSERIASFGPRLDPSTLLQAVPRRGGPPSAYDLAAFCRALRSGVDPAQVLLPRAMPRFDVDDVRCKALWAYLTQAAP